MVHPSDNEAWKVLDHFDADCARDAQNVCIGLKTVVGQDPPTGVDWQHESREAQSLYLSAQQLARALRLRFIGRAT
jgi:hypothetical protein